MNTETKIKDGGEFLTTDEAKALYCTLMDGQRLNSFNYAVRILSFERPFFKSDNANEIADDTDTYRDAKDDRIKYFRRAAVHRLATAMKAHKAAFYNNRGRRQEGIVNV